MKGRLLVAATLVVALTGMTSCTGLMLSSDFGYDDYGPAYGGSYWPNYGIGYNPPLGYYGPAWNTPPPPPRPPQQRPPSKPQQPNGSNRPNYTPTQPSKPQPSKPAVSTTPDGQMRPGNMGQPAPSGNNQSGGNQSGSSGTHRGR
ncbi:MAG: hypothetical protein K2J10_01190 [Muribaculaceae bacterium]|nr:hypothetical protein [Muribaculaceae bacterium]